VNAPHDILDTGASVNVQASENLQVYAGYDIAIGVDTSTDQAVSAGVKYQF
jgi:outer membrane autotransporter protein